MPVSHVGDSPVYVPLPVFPCLVVKRLVDDPQDGLPRVLAVDPQKNCHNLKTDRVDLVDLASLAAF